MFASFVSILQNMRECAICGGPQVTTTVTIFAQFMPHNLVVTRLRCQTPHFF